MMVNIALEWISVPAQARADNARDQQRKGFVPVDVFLPGQHDRGDNCADGQVEPARRIGLVRRESESKQDRQHDRYSAAGQHT
jgi:NADH:ubiquinone oxidoreductase subunit B-like Fe-S oxidoreductase